MQKISVGSDAESLVCSFLELNELTCIERNFSCRLGEIDLIMHEASSNTLVFVEVRFRTNAHYGNATESVDWKKQRKLRRTVLHYLQKNATARTCARIDVVGVCKSDSANLDVPALPQNVTEHHFQNHALTWTRNAIEEH